MSPHRLQPLPTPPPRGQARSFAPGVHCFSDKTCRATGTCLASSGSIVDRLAQIGQNTHVAGTTPQAGSEQAGGHSVNSYRSKRSTVYVKITLTHVNYETDLLDHPTHLLWSTWPSSCPFPDTQLSQGQGEGFWAPPLSQRC